jgi:hypothetical protein
MMLMRTTLTLDDEPESLSRLTRIRRREHGGRKRGVPVATDGEPLPMPSASGMVTGMLA